jgi:hypothetical protein
MPRENKAAPTSGDSNEPVATAPVLARWLGISGKAVYELAKAGVLVRVSRDYFLLEESVRRYCEHLRQAAPQPDPGQGEQPTASDVVNSDANTATELVP